MGNQQSSSYPGNRSYDDPRYKRRGGTSRSNRAVVASYLNKSPEIVSNRNHNEQKEEEADVEVELEAEMKKGLAKVAKAGIGGSPAPSSRGAGSPASRSASSTPLHSKGPSGQLPSISALSTDDDGLAGGDLNGKSPAELVDDWSESDWRLLTLWTESKFRCIVCGTCNSDPGSSDSKADVHATFTVQPRVAQLITQLVRSYANLGVESSDDGESSVTGSVTDDGSAAGDKSQRLSGVLLPPLNGEKSFSKKKDKAASEGLQRAESSLPAVEEPQQQQESSNSGTFAHPGMDSNLGPAACPFMRANIPRMNVRLDTIPSSAPLPPPAPAPGTDGATPGHHIHHHNNVGHHHHHHPLHMDPEHELHHLRVKCAIQRKFLMVIGKAHDTYFSDDTPNGSKVGEYLLSSLLELTHSKFGFVASVLYKHDGAPYIKTHAITNFAWTRDLRAWYMENAHKGLVFHKTNTLFGEVMTTGETVISNDPKSDPRASGTPPGHPPLNTFLGLPAYMGSEMVGMLALANRPEGYDDALVNELQPLLKTVAHVVYGINKRKRRMEAENKLFSVLKVAREGMLTVGPTGFVTSLNPAARNMFAIPTTYGATAANMPGAAQPGEHASESSHLAEGVLPFEDLFYSINHREDFMKLGMDSHLVEVYPALGRRLDGGTIMADISLSKGTSPDVAFVAIVRQMEAPWEKKESVMGLSE